MRRLQETKHALGSTGILTLVVADEAASAGEALMQELWHMITVFERRFSRFLPDSELTKCNQQAGHMTAISPEFRKLVVCATSMAEATGGLYNPFVLPALQRAGYKGSWPHPERANAATSFESGRLARAGDLTIGDTWLRLPPHTALDFGGIGKGYLLDQLAEYIDDQPLVEGYWLSLGGDIICSGHDLEGAAWTVGVQHAIRTDEQVAAISNNGKKLAIATSGTTKRKGTQDGKSWHHIIDPRTGESAQTDVLTATVIAPNATDADVYAKCLVLLGSAAAKEWASEKRIAKAILQHGQPERVIVETIGVSV